MWLLEVQVDNDSAVEYPTGRPAPYGTSAIPERRARASGAYRPVAAACTLGVHESSKAAAWWSRAWWSRYAHRRQRDAAVSYDTTARLDQITVPTLILRGRRDRSLPLPMAEQLHTGITRSQLQVFRGGHMFCFLTERQGLLAFVDEFLTD